MKSFCYWKPVLFLFLVCITAPVFGQSGSRIGVRAGFQTAQLESDVGRLFNSNHNRYFVGLYKETALLPLIKYSAGLEYYETGSRQGLSDLKLGYLSVPLSLKADIGLFNFYGGISGAYRLYADERENGAEIEVPDNKYARFDYSTFVGGGINILFVGIDIRHHWGKTDVYTGYQNRFWQMGATIKF